MAHHDECQKRMYASQNTALIPTTNNIAQLNSQDQLPDILHQIWRQANSYNNVAT